MRKNEPSWNANFALPAPQMIFRPMLEVDLEQVVEIEKASMPSPWSKELFEEELRREAAHYFVVEENERVAGYMGYWEAPEEAHIINLAIGPAFRRRGLGRKMVEACLSFATKRGARLATLEVRESNETARRLYEKCGFRFVAIRKKYYSDNQEDAVVMIREMQE
ncbi:MAG TPA: ribosomal protein S18-alanine N-acetyltransferase [bacterium]|nr:ribosomal protein S18-alanine N-acetyltransferase [bacterium]